MASPVRIGGVSGFQGVEAFRAQLREYPPQVVGDCHQILDEAADELVKEIKANVPVSSELDPHPGALRDSVRKVPGHHELSIGVVEDAKDAQGRDFAIYVEVGHKSRNGGHVAPHPHFFPAEARVRKSLRAAIVRSMKARAKASG